MQVPTFLKSGACCGGLSLCHIIMCTQESNKSMSNTGCDAQDTEEALIQAALELSKKSMKQSSMVDATLE